MSRHSSLLRSEGYVILALGLVVALAAYVVVTRLSVITEITAFMPPGQSPLQQLLISQLDKGPTARLIYIALSDGEPEMLAASSKDLAEKFRQSGLFARVHNGSRKDVDTIRDYLFLHRYLLTSSDVSQKLEVAGLKRALRERLRDLASPLAPVIKRTLRQDPTAELFELGRHWLSFRAGSQQIKILNGVWFSVDERKSLLVLEIQPTGLDVQGQVDTVRDVHRIVDDVVLPRGLSASVSGPPVFVVQTRNILRSDAWTLSIVALLLVAAFLFAVFRSFIIVALVAVPLACSAVVAAAATLLIFGSVHAVTLAFGITLIGVAIDYPIHLISHLRVRTHPPREQVKRIWPTLRMTVLTTIAAYAALLLSSLEGLKQLGLFTAAGLLTAVAITRWVMPYLVSNEINAGSPQPLFDRALEFFGRRAFRLRLPAAVAVGLLAIFLVLTDKTRVDYEIDGLSTISATQRSRDRDLRAVLGLWSGGKLLAVTAHDAEGALVHTEQLVDRLSALAAKGALEGYTTVSQFIPSEAAQRAIQASIPQSTVMRRRLEQAQADTPFKQGVFDPFLRDLESNRTQEVLGAEELLASPIGGLIAPLLFKNEDSWIVLVLLHGVNDPTRLVELSTETEGIETIYLDLKQEISRIMIHTIDESTRVVLLGVVAMYLLLLVHFRSLLRPLRVLGPTLAAVCSTSALLVGSGTPLNLFHLMSLLLVVGLGLDYSLFFNRLRSEVDEWTTTFRALWVCSVTTILVFGLLLFSQTPPLNSIGVTVALGAGLSWLFAAIWALGR